jgi:hypothetical protein
LAWALPEGGVLIFHLTQSLDPIAVLGEGTQWDSVRFTRINGEDVIAAAGHDAQDKAVFRVRHWRYFASTSKLIEFSRASLPNQTCLNTDRLVGRSELPLRSTPLMLSHTDENNLLGVVKWITEAPATSKDSNMVNQDDCSGERKK